MRVKISHELKSPLVLPLAYHHIQQSIIYDCMEKKGNGFFSNIHDNGFVYEKREFRLFTFSEIKGPHKIVDDKIVFYDEVSWEVSSCNREFIETIKNVFMKQKINYAGQYYENVRCDLSDWKIKENELAINMLSPIIVYKTDMETRKKKYYSPDDDYFYGLINDNFIRKYKAYYGCFPDDVPSLRVLNVGKRDKCVTRFKGTYLTGYKGIYMLSGEPEHLGFLYDTGIGSANSQGFGMFELIKG